MSHTAGMPPAGRTVVIARDLALDLVARARMEGIGEDVPFQALVNILIQHILETR